MPRLQNKCFPDQKYTKFRREVTNLFFKSQILSPLPRGWPKAWYHERMPEVVSNEQAEQGWFACPIGSGQYPSLSALHYPIYILQDDFVTILNSHLMHRDHRIGHLDRGSSDDQGSKPFITGRFIPFSVVERVKKNSFPNIRQAYFGGEGGPYWRIPVFRQR